MDYDDVFSSWHLAPVSSPVASLLLSFSGYRTHSRLFIPYSEHFTATTWPLVLVLVDALSCMLLLLLFFPCAEKRYTRVATRIRQPRNFPFWPLCLRQNFLFGFLQVARGNGKGHSVQYCSRAIFSLHQ